MGRVGENIKEKQHSLRELLYGRIGQPVVLRQRKYHTGRHSYGDDTKPSFVTNITLGVLSADPLVMDIEKLEIPVYDKVWVTLPLGESTVRAYDDNFHKWRRAGGGEKRFMVPEVLSSLVTSKGGPHLSKRLADAENAIDYQRSLDISEDRNRVSIELFVGDEVPEFFRSPKSFPRQESFSFEGKSMNPTYAQALQLLGRQDLIPQDFAKAYETFEKQKAQAM